MQATWTTTVVDPAPVGPRLRHLGWLGTSCAALLAAWLLTGRGFLAVAAAGSPPLVLVGSEPLRATVELGGHAQAAFRLALAVLWLAAPLAVATRGYSYASRPGRVAVALVGVLGLAMAVPMAAAVAIVGANLALWSMLLIVGAILFILLLLRILSFPFRR
jgi:hypothetical protein